MSLKLPLPLSIALTYTFKSKAHKFASFVAILSTLGIMIGVAALIIDTAIMSGLQDRLKNEVLARTPHVVVHDNFSNANKYLQMPNVIAVAPFVSNQTLMQSNENLALFNLQGIDDSRIILNKDTSIESLELPKIPEKNSFTLNAEVMFYLRNNLRLGQSVKLISTVNARYTPMGLTPTQRIFKAKDYFPSTNASALDTAIGNYDDVRRLFRMQDSDASIRLWTKDPFKIDELKQLLDKNKVNYSTWESVQGEFFKAVALEKLTMGIMLFLIIILAAFNILSSLSMMVSSRLKEIAILKTLGLKNKKILSIFIIMGLSSGFIGTLLGFIFGIPLSIYAVGLMENLGFGKIPTNIDISNLSIIFLGSILMSLIFTLYPAIKASTTDPVEHLSRG